MSQHPKFKPGDVVKLLSGSPRMTVRGEALDGDTDALDCIWFAESKLQVGTFYEVELFKPAPLPPRPTD